MSVEALVTVLRMATGEAERGNYDAQIVELAKDELESLCKDRNRLERLEHNPERREDAALVAALEKAIEALRDSYADHGILRVETRVANNGFWIDFDIGGPDDRTAAFVIHREACS